MEVKIYRCKRCKHELTYIGMRDHQIKHIDKKNLGYGKITPRYGCPKCKKVRYPLPGMGD